MSLHQVASDDVKRLEENKVLTQGSEAQGTSEETQGAQPEFPAGTTSLSFLRPPTWLVVAFYFLL